MIGRGSLRKKHSKKSLHTSHGPPVPIHVQTLGWGGGVAAQDFSRAEMYRTQPGVSMRKQNGDDSTKTGPPVQKTNQLNVEVSQETHLSDAA